MQKERVLSYDVFRGVLLIGMVVFHVIVNLTNLQFNQELFYWVPLGFVLFLGVVLARFLRGKSVKKIRLALKLLLIFVVGNVPNLLNKPIEFKDFLVGDPALFSFEILFPMVVVILASAVLDRAKQTKTLLVLSFIALISLYFLKIDSYNLHFSLYGLIGYFIARDFDLNSYLQNKWMNVVSVVLSVVPFFVVQYFGFFPLLIVLQVLAMFFLCNLIFGGSKTLVLLGKRSLMLYVAHVIIIRGVSSLI